MSETLSFQCDGCKTTLQVPVQHAGVSGPCPKCGTTITAPPRSSSAAYPATASSADPALLAAAAAAASTAAAAIGHSDPAAH